MLQSVDASRYTAYMTASVKTPERYCRGCGYNLRDLPAPRCPECSRPFDPLDLRTTRSAPLKHWSRPVRRALLVTLCILLIPAASWAWLYWGWYSEQQAVAALKPEAGNVKIESLSPWLRDHIGRSGFIFDRVTYLYLGSSRTDIKEFSPLARLTHLRHLDCYGANIADLSPIAGLTDLEYLALARVPATDLRPLAGLTKLQDLDLRWSKASDFTPLAQLSALQDIELEHATVADISPLAHCKALRFIPLSFGNVSDAQIAELCAALPGCSINRHSSMGDD